MVLMQDVHLVRVICLCAFLAWMLVTLEKVNFPPSAQAGGRAQ